MRSISSTELFQVGTLLDDLLGPDLDLRQLDTSGDSLKLGKINLVAALVLDHLEQKFHLINIVDKLGFECDVILIFLEHIPDILGGQGRAGNIAQQGGDDVVHGIRLATSLLGLGNMQIDRRDIADQRLGHIVNERHLGAVGDVELGGQLLRGKHRHDRHAVHVVRDRLAIDSKAAPAFALGRLKALNQVEEGNRSSRVLLKRVGEGGQHCIGD